jgi:DNA-3-methyladenine glycosylase I
VLDDLPIGTDGRRRCWWAAGSPLLERYHDDEWGRGPRDERGLFERLSLEAFQAGLSWRLVLERREVLRSAFSGFDPATLVNLQSGADGADVDRILRTEGIIRNRAKIAAVLHNAQVLRSLHAGGEGLAMLTEAALAAHPLPHDAPPPRRRSDVPSRSAASETLAALLRERRWRFVGPTTAYAFLQAAGWVDDHLEGCHARLRPGARGGLGGGLG